MTKIHKEVFGQGQPIVLIHGWAMHTGIWRTFAQQLSQYYEVTCLDLPGHGLSEMVEPYTLDQISLALIDVMPEQACCVLGWSLGADVAITLAKNYPQKINSLILLGGNPRFIQDGEWAGMNRQVLEDFALNLSTNCQLTLIRFLALQVNNLQNGKQLLKELKLTVQECDTPKQAVLQAGLDILTKADLRDDLAALSCPINIIQGDKDTLVPVQVAHDIKKIQPNTEVNIIPHAGHVPFLSHQSEVIGIINNFVTE